ncbi:MAG: flagellin FliC [Proteobacteria bacterium]|nr:flagellin FliC [Pseudomonadota bacterium]
MALRINYNLAASVAQRSLGASQDNYAKQAERLATGLRINKAGDDAAGMAVSERLKNQVRGLNQAARNAQDGISMVQTAEGAMSEAHTILARMRELAIQASNDTVTANDRTNLMTEFSSLYSEIDRIANATQFNGTAVLNGTQGNGLVLQIGANKSSGGDNAVTLNISPSSGFQPTMLGGVTMSALSITAQSAASNGITVIDAAVNAVSTARASLGALQSRLESAGRSIAVASENAAAANSRIADADIAGSMSELVRAQILQQAGISVLAQANQAPSLVLQLLK